MADTSESQSYLLPKTKNPKAKQVQKSEMFVNQPNYMELGGLTGPSKLNRGAMSSSMKLESGGPSAKQGKPI